MVNNVTHGRTLLTWCRRSCVGEHCSRCFQQRQHGEWFFLGVYTQNARNNAPRNNASSFNDLLPAGWRHPIVSHPAADDRTMVSHYGRLLAFVVQPADQSSKSQAFPVLSELAAQTVRDMDIRMIHIADTPT